MQYTRGWGWNILGCLILAPTPSALHYLSYETSINPVAYYSLHHGKMLQIVMSLEQSVPCEELDQYTADTPNITRETPAEIQNDLWGPVMSGGNNGRVIFVIEGRRPKINQTNLAVQQNSSLTCAAGDRV